MNQDPVYEAFLKGKLRFKPSAALPVPRAFEHLKKTADGWLLGVQLVDELSKGLNEITGRADQSQKFVAALRPLSDGRLGFEFQSLYVDEPASEGPSEKINEPATADTGEAAHAPEVKVASAARAISLAEAPFELGTDDAPPPSSSPAMPERRSESQALSIPAPMPSEQQALDLKRASTRAETEADHRLAHELLMDYHADPRRSRWYEDFMPRIERDAGKRELVLQLLREVDHWSDTSMSVGPDLCWDGLSGIKTALPFEKPLVFLGYIEVLEKPEFKRVKVSCEHLVTGHYAEAIRLLSRGNPATMRLGIGSDELSKRLALYWDRGLVRFKVRLSRELALEAPFDGVIEDAYLEDPSIEDIDALTKWAVDVISRRPPEEPLWTERSL
jgi:hypothetical protein